MLQIKINASTILPMRSDAPEKTFSSSDVPHGTQSVVYKAIKVYNSNGGNVPLPTFSEDEIAAHKAAFLATVEVLPLADSEGNAIDYLNIGVAENQVLEPTEAEVEAEYYAPVDEANPEAVRTPKMVSNFSIDLHGESTPLYADLAACKSAMIEARKDACAQRLLDKAVEECLIVPELSEDFMAQFELIEVESV